MNPENVILPKLPKNDFSSELFSKLKKTNKQAKIKKIYI